MQKQSYFGKVPSVRAAAEISSSWCLPCVCTFNVGNPEPRLETNVLLSFSLVSCCSLPFSLSTQDVLSPGNCSEEENKLHKSGWNMNTRDPLCSPGKERRREGHTWISLEASSGFLGVDNGIFLVAFPSLTLRKRITPFLFGAVRSLFTGLLPTLCNTLGRIRGIWDVLHLISSKLLNAFSNQDQSPSQISFSFALPQYTLPPTKMVFFLLAFSLYV